MTRVGIIGGSGYGGGELLRLLAGHPDVEVRVVTSNTYAGKPVEAAFPGLAGRTALRFAAEGADLAGCKVIFLARDNGYAMREAGRLLEAGCKVIDLSADFRFRDASI